MIVFFLVVCLVLPVMAVVYRYWRKGVDAGNRAGAAIEWAYYSRHEQDFIQGIDREKFNAIYARVHTPRFPGYALACFAVFVIMLPVMFILQLSVLWFADMAGFMPEAGGAVHRLMMENGEVRFFSGVPPVAVLYYTADLAGFYYFFSILAMWVMTVAVFMYRFHTRAPGYMRDEIIREQEKRTTCKSGRPQGG